MKLKELEALLQDVSPFERPKVELEQYPTRAHIAARMLYTVGNTYGELEGMVVDLGCGTGMLAIGAAALGCPHVLGIDVDADALAAAGANLAAIGDDLPVDLLRCDVAALGAQARLRADTVVMNPPFGTRQRGADLEFLRAAFRVSAGAVYSLHKSSTRAHVARVAAGELHAASAEVLAQLRFDLPASYAFHRHKTKDIEVDLWRFEVSSSA
ncbi:hypothetical protein WJX81_004343 [Elliptochloris bilobata]|uniref:Methyltransferase-like protein 5 n=1 Tax=Elliptochloris bilobata TaxID=381761 RepID=A0AAW1S0Y1_9CHLO